MRHVAALSMTRRGMSGLPGGKKPGTGRLPSTWLHKRTDFEYQRQLWQRRHETDDEIGRLLAEARRYMPGRIFQPVVRHASQPR